MAIVGISLRTAASAMASTTLGPADGYSAFVFGNMTAATDTWGSVAVGGDANFSGGYSINSATAGNNYALIVGGELYAEQLNNQRKCHCGQYSHLFHSHG